MRLVKTTVDEFSERITGRNVYCFGAGRELYHFFGEFCSYHMEKKIKNVVDNCREKCGTIVVNNAAVSVIHTGQMLREIGWDDVILVTTASFMEVADGAYRSFYLRPDVGRTV